MKRDMWTMHWRDKMDLKQTLVESKRIVESMNDEELVVMMKMCMDEFFRRTKIGEDLAYGLDRIRHSER